MPTIAQQYHTTLPEWSYIDFAPNYAISSDGTVLSLKGRNPRVLRPWLNTRGYWQVDIDGRPFLVHRLVAHAFLSAPFTDCRVRFINGDRSDVRLANLRWHPHAS